MLRPELDWETCQICEPCRAKKVCKVRAIVQLDPGEAPFIDLSRCNGCGNCIPACHHQAIQMRSNLRGSAAGSET